MAEPKRWFEGPADAAVDIRAKDEVMGSWERLVSGSD